MYMILLELNNFRLVDVPLKSINQSVWYQVVRVIRIKFTFLAIVCKASRFIVALWLVSIYGMFMIILSEKEVHYLTEQEVES